MTDLRTAAQQALEALYEETAWFGPTPKGAAAIAALKAALAQQDEPVQEPVAKLSAQRDALLKALKDILLRDEKNTCRHGETHRGGAIWEICDSCGSMWADDKGGKPEWEEPKEWTQARAAIKAVEGEKT